MPPSRVGYSGPGFLFKFSADGVNFTTIALAKDVKGALTAGKVDVSTQDMGDRFRRFDPELVDPGTYAFEIIYRPDNATHESAFAALVAGTALNFTYYTNPPSNSHYESGAGFFTKFELTGPVGGDQTASIEFQRSGAVTHV
jgi:hypothetical protein